MSKKFSCFCPCHETFPEGACKDCYPAHGISLRAWKNNIEEGVESRSVVKRLVKQAAE